MIENFDDFISLAAIAGIFIVTLTVAVRVFFMSNKKDDSEDFFREIL